MSYFPLRGNVLYYIMVFTFTVINAIFIILIPTVKCIFKGKLYPKNRKERPACLRDRALGEHGYLELQNRDGIKIHYVANGSRSKPLILFLHGFPEFWYTWKYQLEEFSKDYYAVAIDMVGYGESSVPTEVSRYSIKEISRDMKELIHELGYTSCVLVGIDWGALITFGTSIEYPEVVNRMIVMNGPHPSSLYHNQRLKQLFLSSYMYYFQVPYLPEYGFAFMDYRLLDILKGANKNSNFYDEETIDALKYSFHKSGFTGPLNYYRMLLSPSDVTAKDVEVPSLMIWGTEDNYLSIELKVRKETLDCVDHKVNGNRQVLKVNEAYEVNKGYEDLKRLGTS